MIGTGPDPGIAPIPEWLLKGPSLAPTDMPGNYPSLARMHYRVSGFLGRREITFIPALRLYLLLFGRRRPWMRPVERDTELVLEGFPRSANSFALWAFLQAQGRPVKLAHHLHAEAHVLRAMRLKRPTLILIRPPLEAALSFNVMMPDLMPDQILHRYIRFYSILAPMKNAFVLATFEEVTTDFGRIIERINQRFGTAFVPFVHSPENLEAVFLQIDRHHKQYYGRGKNILPHVLPRPVEDKNTLKKRFLAGFQTPSIQPLVEKAIHTYQDFLE